VVGVQQGHEHAEDQPAQYYMDAIERGSAGRGHLVLLQQAAAYPPVQDRGLRHDRRGRRYTVAGSDVDGEERGLLHDRSYLYPR
jgi:hypothetical protein